MGKVAFFNGAIGRTRELEFQVILQATLAFLFAQDVA
jgi:hypothetical protein